MYDRSSSPKKDTRGGGHDNELFEARALVRYESVDGAFRVSCASQLYLKPPQSKGVLTLRSNLPGTLAKQLGRAITGLLIN